MKHRNISTYYLVLLCIIVDLAGGFTSSLFALHEIKKIKEKAIPSADTSITSKSLNTNAQVTAAIEKIDNSKEKTITSIDNPLNPLISFDYTDENLTAIINHCAALTNNNIILPQGVLAIKEKVTIHLQEEKTLDFIWNNLLPTILDVAGYSIYKKENTYTVIRNDKDINREPAPLYIGIAPDKLPDTDQRIRYIYFLANIKVSAIKDTLQKIVAGIMPPDTLFETDTLSNALILGGKAHNIRNSMDIIIKLDQTNFHETMAIIRLRYVAASTVASMFMEQIIRSAMERDRYKLDTRKEPRENYFADTTKIIPDMKSNSLIVLGRPQAIERIKNFIYDHIDVELESGKSILHVYKLQYLDAHTLVPTLERIIKSENIGGTGQSRGQQGTQNVGTERFFEGVVIRSDQLDMRRGEKLAHPGGNNLVIAARHDDWIQIKKLIETLDIPEWQVLVEVLIADLTLADTRELGSITRNPGRLPFDINFQSAQFGNIIVEPSNRNPKTIRSDLLRSDGIIPPGGDLSSIGDLNSTKFSEAPKPVSGSDALSAAGAQPGQAADLSQQGDATAFNSFTNAALVPGAGGTVVSFNDKEGKSTSLLQFVRRFNDSKILSHPHIIATNNMPAHVGVGEERLLKGEASGSTGGAGLLRYERISAKLDIHMTPRITADTINLNIKITINQFMSPTDNSRLKREFETNANIADGSVLALGGLIRKTNSTTQKETPILGQIPIIGWLFKDRTGGMAETNLTVFILPTIIKPRLRPGISKYTEDYVTLAQQYAREGELFSALKDPITRWFFKTDSKTENIVNNFLAKDEFKLDFTSTSSHPEPAQSEQIQLKMEPSHGKSVNNKQVQNDQLQALLKDADNPFISTATTTHVITIPQS